MSARELVDKGDWAAGCAKFQASLELDPAPSTLLNLSRCRERDGKLVEAWYMLQQALKLNRENRGQTDRRREELEGVTLERLAGIERRVPRLRISLTEAPAGVRVRRDGAIQPASTFGEPLPLDPGIHEIVVDAPGFVEERRSVAIVEGQALDVTITLTRLTHPIVRSAAPRPNDARSAPPSGGAPSTSRRTIGFVVGGVGVAGLAAGGVLGALTLAKAGGAASDASGNADRDAARATQTAAFVSAGVGVVALGAGVALVLTAPAKPRSSGRTSRVVVGAGPGAVSLSGAW
jgi:hypothetical protein